MWENSRNVLNEEQLWLHGVSCACEIKTDSFAHRQHDEKDANARPGQVDIIRLGVCPADQLVSLLLSSMVDLLLLLLPLFQGVLPESGGRPQEPCGRRGGGGEEGGGGANGEAGPGGQGGGLCAGSS